MKKFILFFLACTFYAGAQTPTPQPELYSLFSKLCYEKNIIEFRGEAREDVVYGMFGTVSTNWKASSELFETFRFESLYPAPEVKVSVILDISMLSKNIIKLIYENPLRRVPVIIIGTYSKDLSALKGEPIIVAGLAIPFEVFPMVYQAFFPSN